MEKLYQLAVQLKRIQLHLTPGVAPCGYSPPSPLPVFFIKQGKVCDYVIGKWDNKQAYLVFWFFQI